MRPLSHRPRHRTHVAALSVLLALCACDGGPSPPSRAGSAPKDLLGALGAWDGASSSARLAAAEEVGRRHTDFSLVRMESFSGGEETHEIAIYHHAATALEFALLPVGSFDMGCTEDTLSSPVHRVTLSRPFLLCRTEVPQSTWDKLMGAQRRSLSNPPDVPATNMTWGDAARFCASVGLELPSEAQWEWACRAGTTTRWSFGDDEALLTQYAWFDRNSKGVPHPVGEKRASAFGLFDMEGNVSEFCADWLGPYPAGPVTDPTGSPTPMLRVARGGNWVVQGELTRPVWRLRMNPAETEENCGLRPAKTCSFD